MVASITELLLDGVLGACGFSSFGPDFLQESAVRICCGRVLLFLCFYTRAACAACAGAADARDEGRQWAQHDPHRLWAARSLASCRQHCALPLAGVGCAWLCCLGVPAKPAQPLTLCPAEVNNMAELAFCLGPEPLCGLIKLICERPQGCTGACCLTVLL